MVFQSFRRFPLFVQVMFACAIAMFLPMALAWEYGQMRNMQAFGVSAISVSALALLLGVLLMDRKHQGDPRDHLLSLVIIFLILPFVLAMPIVIARDDFTWFRAAFEMLSSLTTTGATLIDFPFGSLMPIFLYSALISWIGAFLILLFAFAVFEPLGLGGYELVQEMETMSGRQIGGEGGNSNRIFHYFRVLAPPFVISTLLVIFGLAFAGERFLFAVIHGLSIMATSGLSPFGHTGQSEMSFFGEFIIVLFLFAALSRHFLLNLGRGRWPIPLRSDPETRALMVIALIGLTVFCYFFWLEQFKLRNVPNIKDFLLSAWGMFFTTISFLTTHGYISEFWQHEINQIEIHTSSIYLIGLTVLGGGVATTAGGIKLLRIYALAKLSERELGRLIDPHSIAASGHAGRHLRKRGGLNAFVFLMLFFAGVSTAGLAFTAAGMGFEEGLISAIAAATNCGPVLDLLPQHHVDLNVESDFVLTIFGLTMIFGRVEVFVLIALLNPSYWQLRSI